MQAYFATISRRNVILGSAAVASALMVGTPISAFADPTAAEKQAEADAALAQLNAMQSSLDNAETNYHDALAEQQAAQEKMAEAQTKIDEASEEISSLQSKISTRARSMYRTGASSVIDLLLGATTFKEFTTNWDLLTSINENDEKMVQQSKDLRQQLQDEKNTYAEQEKLAADKAEEAKNTKENAAAVVSAMQATYDSLSDEVAEILAQEVKAQEAEAAANTDKVLAEASVAATQWYETINASRSEGLSTSNSSSNSNNSSNSSSHSNSSSNSESNSSASSDTQDTSTNDSYNDSTDSNNDSSYDDNSYDDSSDYEDNSSSTVKEPSYDVSTGNAIVDRAYSWVGIADYEWGACEPGLFDCSGFVSYCLTGSYSRIGSTSTFINWPHVSDPQPGDVCVNDGHCGIYIGGGSMIHAPTYGYKVSVGAVQSGMVFVRY